MLVHQYCFYFTDNLIQFMSRILILITSRTRLTFLDIMKKGLSIHYTVYNHITISYDMFF